MDNIINGSVVVVVALAPTEAMAMSGEMVHFQAIMVASVGLQMETPSLRRTRHPDSIIVHFKSKGRDRQGI